MRQRQKRRNAIEPVIGHTKNDGKSGPRNWLKGEEGDKMNAIAMAIGFNMRKLAAAIYYILIKLRLMRLVLLPRYTCTPAF